MPGIMSANSVVKQSEIRHNVLAVPGLLNE